MKNNRIKGLWRSKGTYLKFITIGFIFAASLHLIVACWEIDDYGYVEEIEVDKKAIKKGANSIEEAFIKSDVEMLEAIMSESAMSRYQEDLETIEADMELFGQAFKSRKLIYATDVFALYEFKFDGEKYTLEMALDEEGNWKLARF